MSSATPALDDAGLVEGTSLWKDAWRRLRKNRMAVAGGAFVVFLVAASFVGPFLTGYGFEEQNLDLGAVPRSLKAIVDEAPTPRILLPTSNTRRRQLEEFGSFGEDR